MAAFFVAGWFNERVQDSSNLCEVDGGLLDQGENESGKEVDSTGVPIEVGFQGLLEFCMLFRRASDLSLREAPIVSYGVLDGHHRLMSGTMLIESRDAQFGTRASRPSRNRAHPETASRFPLESILPPLSSRLEEPRNNPFGFARGFWCFESGRR